MKRIVTGILMEVGENSAVIMTKEGEFLKVRKPSPGALLGEEITSSTANLNRVNFAKLGVIAAAILLLLIPFSYFQQAMATVAYVNVDINPSLELGINKYNKVNSVKALNSDGEALIKDMPLKSLDINEALDKVITGAKEQGYINDEKQNNIEIALVKIDDSKVNISQESLVDYVKELEPKINVDATVKIQGADKKTHDEAKRENTSTNKYMDKSKENDDNAVKIKIKKEQQRLDKEDKKDDKKEDDKVKTAPPSKKEDDSKDKGNKRISSDEGKENKDGSPEGSSHSNGGPSNKNKGKGNSKK